MPLGVLLVHGVGDQKPEWADAHIRLLQQRLGQELAGLVAGQAPDPREAFLMGRVHWAGVLQGPQRALRHILDIAHAPEPSSVDDSLWSKALKWVAGAVRQKESQLIAEFIGDVIGYRADATRAGIYETITRSLEELAQRLPAGQGKAPLTIIAHSLGAVIISDYVWDQAKARRQQGKTGFHERWRLENFFTLGSPMALFALQYGGAQAFHSPIALESPRGRWINIFDTNDPIGMPLRPLNEAYRKAVLADAQVQVGHYLLAHGGYFTNEAAIRIISRKLAVDWCAEYDRLPAERLQQLASQYDHSVWQSPATISSMVRRRPSGIMLSELLYFLLIIGVLVGLFVSIKIRNTQRPIAPHRDLSLEKARYVPYLGYIPDVPSEGPSNVPSVDPVRDPADKPDVPEPPERPDPAASRGAAPARPKSSRAPASVLSRAAALSEAPLPPEPDPVEGPVAINMPKAGAARSQSLPADQDRGVHFPVGLSGAGGGKGAGVSVQGANTTIAADKTKASSASTAPLDKSDEQPAGAGVTIAAPEGTTQAGQETAGGRKPRKLRYRPRGDDVWTHWPDASKRTIGGRRGVMHLTRAMDILAQSGAKAILEDLERKGILVAFGEESEFADAGEHAAALLIYRDTDRPPFTPRQAPALKINPKYVNEDPRVLAAVIAHEGTHFQQYLDGTLLDRSHSRRDAEADAWVNGAAFWQEIRNSEGLPLTSELARQEEVNFQMVRQGEGPLRDLIAALYPTMR